MRFKLNIFASGFCACGALVGAMAHAPLILGWCLGWGIVCWIVGNREDK